MALNIKNMETAHAGKGLKIWTYATTDTKATVKGAGYFNGAKNLLQVKDKLVIGASDAVFEAKVSAISGAGVVTIAAVDAFA